jgi:hypothetical protein
LLDADSRELVHLPDPSDRVDVLISGLDSGRTYYVESRLRAVTPASGAKGQISASGPLECRGDGGRAVGPVTTPGRPLLCRARLLNLGPRTLENVLVRLSSVWNGRTATLTATASATDAEPSTTDLFEAPMLDRGRVRAVEFVPRSARLLTDSRELIGTYLSNPFGQPLIVGELRPGATHARYFEFAIRLVR